MAGEFKTKNKTNEYGYTLLINVLTKLFSSIK
jgi:hypothetical protein